MTATIVENEQAVEEEIQLEEPCEGLVYENYECPNPAAYRLRTSCCGTLFGWCETCFFEWIEHSKEHEGLIGTCAYCFNVVHIGPNHVIVVGRIK